MMSNADRKLPVVPDVAETSCGCDRRTVLGGLAIGALVAGCRIDDPGADPAPVDGPETDGGGTPGTGFEVNGNTVTVDLTHPMNVKLLDVGGTRNIVAGTKKTVIVRTSDTEFATLTAVCTHSGCTVAYKVAPNELQCPCHGSKFMVDGTLIIGAGGSTTQANLKTFANNFDMPGNLLTITLS